MDTFVRCAGIAVLGAALTILTKKNGGEFTVLISVFTMLLLMYLAFPFLRSIFSFMEELRIRAKVGQGLYEPVLKAVGIGFLTEIGGNVCENAGEKGIAGSLRMAGNLASIYVILPLLQNVLTLLEQLL